MTAEEIAGLVIAQAAGKTRHLVAIAGPPGAGKSTFAFTLQKFLSAHNLRSKIVPMDGFHLDNTTLSTRGLLERKGAPETFDADGFVSLIKKLVKSDRNITIPGFDRDTDSVIADVDIVTRQDAILIVEGNYLLVDTSPWSKLKRFWGQTIFINPGIETLEQRLIKRWLDQGLNPEQARTRAAQNDIPNAHYVLDHSSQADIQITRLDAPHH